MGNRRKLKPSAPTLRPRAVVDFDGYPPPGAVNGYRCRACGKITVTVHLDAGVTPMFLACRATEGCNGDAVSGGYQTPPGGMPDPAFEWYRPTGIELYRLEPDMVDYVNRGGLALRSIA